MLPEMETETYQPAPMPADEEARLQALRDLHVLDTEDNPDFDMFASLAKEIFGTPIALVSFVDAQRQWFKACYGVDVRETPRDVAFCAYAVLMDDVLVVNDAAKHPIFRQNPLVVNHPYIRFYAGAPIHAANGQPLGTLCVIDTKPHPQFDAADAQILTKLATLVSKLLLAKSDSANSAAHSSAKTDFLSHMSHELRTPLNAVIGIANLLRRQKLDEKTTMLVQTLNVAADSLLDLINNILDISSIEQGKLELDERLFPLGKLLAEIESMASVRANEKEIRFTIDADQVRDGQFLGDKLRIKQILTNLAGNAIKFTNKGAVTLSLRREGDQLAIIVRDTGIGIAADKLTHIFTAYGQGHTSQSRYQGTGLGLAITQKFVEKMNGTLRVASVLGEGSTFTVLLPWRAE